MYREGTHRYWTRRRPAPTRPPARPYPFAQFNPTAQFASLALLAIALLLGAAWTGANLPAQEPWRPILPEQRALQIRSPSQLAPVRIPSIPAPPTVDDPQKQLPGYLLSLDDAIRIALQNANVVRVLAGTTATASGRTIYDPAVANTQIDIERARFDPRLTANNNWFRSDPPSAFPDPTDPDGVRFGGLSTDNYDLDFALSKTTGLGGTAALGIDSLTTRFKNARPLLDPRQEPSLELSYTQPLLRGFGWRANSAPIVVARIDTERSYFQFKDSVQELVRGVVEAYWAVVFARTDVWARQQQVAVAEEDFNRAEGQFRAELVSIAEVAQPRAALANFRASLISAEANLLAREAALRNIMGLPPSEPRRPVPVTFPAVDRLEPDWEALLELASVQRPDLIELKLILEADEQLLLRARNQALPSLDAVGLYRWNGLSGVTPDQQFVSSEGGQFTDWQLGVNFSVPLGLRQERASVRRLELLIFRDRANLQQGLHNASHVLAGNLRNLALAYQQYQAFQDAREAAFENLQAQRARYLADLAIYLNVLQALNDWGNAVSSEAQALTLYNTELANLERETGTILESHGIRPYEERYFSVGPIGPLVKQERLYPLDVRPTPNADRYPAGEEPAENRFDLRNQSAAGQSLRREDPAAPEVLPPGEPQPQP